MSEFDEWYEENFMMVSADRAEAEDIYNLGKQSQQAKIDELQARIDEAMDYIAESGGVNLTSEIVLNHILKGNKDEK